MPTPPPPPPPTLHPPPNPRSRPSRRILGSLNNPPKHSTPPPSHRNPSPSPSTLSATSTTFTSATHTSSRPASTNPFDSPAPLICPICSEELSTLLQLNRHLDDRHTEVEPLEKDDITSWFRKRMIKAKQFQPVAVLGQKLRGGEVWERNDVIAATANADGLVGEVVREVESFVAPGKDGDARDPDYYVTRQHWVMPRGGEVCGARGCGKQLGVVNGEVNCRKCGGLFCERCTMYQIKLSRSAQHEPVRGFWCRVCKGCYEGREGYWEVEGVCRDRTGELVERRRGRLERERLEVARLEKRLTKLTQLLVSPPPPSSSSSNRPPLNPATSSFLKSALSRASPRDPSRKQLEQSIVPWQDDSSASSCPECHQPFSTLSNRKHHCRICGRLVCGDPRTLCSSEHNFDVAVPPSPSLSPSQGGEKPPPQTTTLSIRICSPCSHTLFSHRDFLRSVSDQPPIVRSYSALCAYRATIDEMLPRFKRAVEKAQDDPKLTNIQAAERSQKRIIEGLGKLESTAKKVREMGDGTLVKAVSLAALGWAREKTLEVKMMVGVLESVKRELVRREAERRNGGGGNGGIRESPGDRRRGMEEEEEGKGKDEKERDLMESIMVLQEQGFMLEGMIGEARKRRRLDEVAALVRSKEECEREAERLRREVEDLVGAVVA